MEKGGAGGEGERECAVCIRASPIGAATNGHRRERKRERLETQSKTKRAKRHSKT